MSSAPTSPPVQRQKSAQSLTLNVNAKLQQLQLHQQQHGRLPQRTPSQSSIHSNASPQNGSHTPLQSYSIASPPPLNQIGQVRCLQTLSQVLDSTHSALEATEGERDDDKGNGSVLSLALDEEHVFSGSQRGHIYVWNRETFRLERILYGHTAGCLAMAVDDARGVLYSGGGDGKVRAWDVHTLECLYVVYAGVNSGSILSLVYSRTHDVLVLGCQNTSIQVFDVANKDSKSREERLEEIATRHSGFFDSAKPASESTEQTSEPAEESYVVFGDKITPHAHSGYVYSILLGSLSGNSINAVGEEDILFSAASDGDIKLWRLNGATLENIGSLDRSAMPDSYGGEDEDVCIHSLAVNDGLLFAGLQSGAIEVWDLETRQRIRVLAGTSSANVFSLMVHSHCLYAGAADGTIRVWDTDLQLLGRISCGNDSVLALVAPKDDDLLIGGTEDGAISFWDTSAIAVSLSETTAPSTLNLYSLSKDNSNLQQPQIPPFHEQGVQSRRHRGRRMLQALGQWIQLKSVSGVPELQSECRRAARFLKDLMRQLGAADARLISSMPSSNPLVYGRFDASLPAANTQPLAQRPTIFIYGHYDVMPAGDEALWRTDPFEMVGRNGYLYGRGVSDDKGPVLAALFAISEMAASGQLPMTVVFCIEGEEENRSVGLHETIEDNRELFGVPQLILLSLSYWLGESTPCLTYGMRGSIAANMRIESTRKADVHSGVWGGAVNEPLISLSYILSHLSDPSGRIQIPGFHDGVRPVCEKEEAAMRDLVQWIIDKEAHAPLVTRTVLSPISADPVDLELGSGNPEHSLSPEDVDRRAKADLYNQLMQRWRFPTLTVHHMDVSTVAARSNTTLVPAAAQASLSVRVVPDQSLEDIAEKLRTHIEHLFDNIKAQRRQSVAEGQALLDDLKLHLDVQPNAQWWLADPETPVYKAAAKAIHDEWYGSLDDVDGNDSKAHVPLLIREGGSIAAIPWLESFFAPHAVAVNLPMGQSSDNAHLDNERISLVNLMRGRQVIQRLVKDIDQVLQPTP
ncbi:hypothetical protein H4S08_001942 [Coemansia sp. RSA 1365]|nr:hypothetical protein H4S08_001942 [Coemansia sp. RSA 1365]